MATQIPVENRELAFKVWSECGQNLSETAKVLESQHSWKVTRQTLTKLRDDYNWSDRAARIAEAKRRRQESSSADFLLDLLIDQLFRYQEYFDSLPQGKVDNQSTYAYTGLIEKIMSIKKQIGETKLLETVEQSAKEKGLPPNSVELIRAALIQGVV